MNWYPSKYPLIINPYDSFMKKHLQHYGYFTGRNLTIKRFGFEPKKGYKSNNDSDVSDSETEENNSDTNNNNNNNDPNGKAPLKNRINEQFKWWSKENRNMYQLGINDLDYQREPRWPIEMQVLPGRIKHINVIPKEAEAFYTRTGLEETPMVNIDSKQKTVFYYNPLHCGYFVKSRVGGSREGCKNVRIDLGLNEQEDTLIFESRFESGNLMKAIKVGEYEYDLYLRFDLYTDKHTQWFYFQITNAKPNKKYRFTICNFLKSDSLYNMGMRPLLYSEYDAENKKLGWRRWGSDIKYYRNNIKSEDYNGNSRTFYSLTWTCEFPNDKNDVYYFAHCYPYTYSDLQDYIKDIQEDPVKSKYCKVKVLCRSLAENLIHLLTITNQSNSSEEHKAKKGVVITARVHPGETNSSWMMHGFLDFLLGNSADAKLLRDNFVFKIVPMLNPDGVIIGNYRCSLTGRDLNRNYKTILKEAFPPVWHTREMVRRFNEEREIVVYCDLHGHSRRQNIFMYGCHNNKDERRRFKERIFPLILSKNSRDKFSYKYCRFKIQKSKDGTGRIVMWNLGILNSFTLEATFAGATIGSKAGYHFSTKDLEQIGVEFCDSILDYCDPDQTKCRILYRQIEQSIKDLVRKKLEQRGLYNFTGDLNNLNDVDLNIDEIVASSSGEESSDGGAESDSSADDGLPLHLERFAKNARQRNKKRKNKINKTINQPKGKEKDKRSASKGINEALSDKKASAAQQIPQHPRSAKALNNGIPIFTHERAEERAVKQKITPLGHHNDGSIINQDTINNQQQSQPTNSSLLNHEDANISLKYTSHLLTLPATNRDSHLQSAQSHSSNNHQHLCEQHKKKLSDFFLFRMEGLQKDNKKNESDGNASDDEAEVTLEERNSHHHHHHHHHRRSNMRPTFEDYINKYVLSKFDQNKTTSRNYLSHGSGSAYNQTPISGSTKFPQTGTTKIFPSTSQQSDLNIHPLEIKPLFKEDTQLLFDEKILSQQVKDETRKKTASASNAPNSTTITTYETLNPTNQNNSISSGNNRRNTKTTKNLSSAQSNKEKYAVNKVNQTYVTSFLTEQNLSTRGNGVASGGNDIHDELTHHEQQQQHHQTSIFNSTRNKSGLPEKFSRPLPLRQRTNNKSSNNSTTNNY